MKKRNQVIPPAICAAAERQSAEMSQELERPEVDEDFRISITENDKGRSISIDLEYRIPEALNSYLTATSSHLLRKGTSINQIAEWVRECLLEAINRGLVFRSPESKESSRVRRMMSCIALVQAVYPDDPEGIASLIGEILNSGLNDTLKSQGRADLSDGTRDQLLFGFYYGGPLLQLWYALMELLVCLSEEYTDAVGRIPDGDDYHNKIASSLRETLSNISWPRLAESPEAYLRRLMSYIGSGSKSDLH
jgi:hypothetical protein